MDGLSILTRLIKYGFSMRPLVCGLVALAVGIAPTPPLAAQSAPAPHVTNAFDAILGTASRRPKTLDIRPKSAIEKYITEIADGSRGRIGVAALDLTSGEEVAVLGDQRFPMASTSKIAIAATFLQGVDQGRWSLSNQYPLLIPVNSAKFSSAKAPVREGDYLPASQLIDLMITRSSNTATDALLKVIGGPEAVNAWMRKAGIAEFNLERDIATLVRDDGQYDPASFIDRRDSATPRAMAKLLAGLHNGKWLSASSRAVIFDAMERCITGKNRIPAALPSDARLAHKTGTLNNTSSDIGIIQAPDGRTFALAIYVTGQGSKAGRDAKIAEIAGALYEQFARKDIAEGSAYPRNSSAISAAERTGG